MRVMSAGAGFRYLLQSVVVGDGDRSMSSPLTRYYAEKGTPPGRWLGSGLPGLASGTLHAGDPVTERQLRRLLGQMQDPETGEPLGRASYRYKTTSERIAARVRELSTGLGASERAEQIAQIESDELGRDHRRTVAGFDFTFSVPKSVSAVWAVADGGTQALIAQAHHAAIEEVLDFVEREVAATRVGANGVAQIDVLGVVATAFDHWDSRASDPQLHTHVVIANRVQATDGKWRTLDGRPLHAAVVAISEHYNAVLADGLARMLGVGWEQRDRGRDRNPAWEITGVPEALIREFSSRSVDIDAEKDRLIERYAAEHGRQPSAQTVIRLRQQATLSTRPDKTLHSLAELTVQWRERATAVLGEDAPTWAQYLTAHNPRPPLLRADDLPLDDLRGIGKVVVAQVGVKRSTWRRWNLHAEASRQTMGLRFASAEDREAVVGLIVDAAEAASLRLTPPELVNTPAAFTRADGSSAFRPRHHTVFSSTALLDAEDRLLRLAADTTAPSVDLTTVGRAVRMRGPGGVVLSSDQRRVVEQIAVSGRVVDLLVGPAGTGKTTTLGALRRAWEAAHGPGSVTGLAPSAAAAEVLAADLGIPTENTSKWLYEHHRGVWNLAAGQLLIVDEASLAGTLALDQLAAHAAESGAKLLLVGDWAQLASVDAGGAFGLLARERGDAPELTDVRRFTAGWEKSASLGLRLGHTDVLAAYDEHERLVGGDLEDMLDAAYQAWRSDRAAGRTSILVAETLDIVTSLNARARSDLILAGEVAPGGVLLRDGNQAGEGDLVITRENDRRFSTGRGWVKNGDRWRVTATHEDGSVTVRRADSRFAGSIVLPAAYVADSVDLGYALTVHRAQGSTVDTTHAIVHSSSMTRESFYVAMTRGRRSNIAYVATDQAHLERHQQDDEETTVHSILNGVIGHEGAEKSAHETITAEQDVWSSIPHLGDQYETIAQAAQAEHVAALLTGAGLPEALLDDTLASDSYGSLVAEVRRVQANGHRPQAVLTAVIRAGGLDHADDIAGLIRSRITRLTHARSVGSRAASPARYIAGLIPEATGPMPADMRQALTELRQAIEQRANALAHTDVATGVAWTRRLGPLPADARETARWWRATTTIAAYRDRYGITGTDPLGPKPASILQQIDHQRADAALRRAQQLATTKTARPTETAERSQGRDPLGR
jgi:conjugative relaxase-like TrwC/TraI family protein